MHFDSFFASAKIRSDLLVESASNYKRHHLALARCKACDSPLDRAANGLFQAPPRVQAKRLIDCCIKSHVVDRLRQKVHCTRLHGEHAGLNISHTSQKHDWGRTRCSRQSVLQLESIQAWHTNI